MPAHPKIEMLALSALKPYERNSRTHSAAQIEKIAKAIQEFGFLVPVVVDKDGGILAGHARVSAAVKLGLSEVPCLRAAHLTEAQRRAFVIADNRVAEDSGWDQELLRGELAFLSDSGFDLPVLGFELPQIDAMLGALDEGEFVVSGAGGAGTANGAAGTATKTQNGFAAFTVVLPVEQKRALTDALRDYQVKHKLADVAAAILHMAGVRNG